MTGGVFPLISHWFIFPFAPVPYPGPAWRKSAAATHPTLTIDHPPVVVSEDASTFEALALSSRQVGSPDRYHERNLGGKDK
jgi:hypothetical protein